MGDEFLERLAVVPHLSSPALITPAETTGIELLLCEAWSGRVKQQARFSSSYPCICQGKASHWTFSHTSRETVLRTLAEAETWRREDLEPVGEC